MGCLYKPCYDKSCDNAEVAGTIKGGRLSLLHQFVNLYTEVSGNILD